MIELGQGLFWSRVSAYVIPLDERRVCRRENTSCPQDVLYNIMNIFIKLK